MQKKTVHTVFDRGNIGNTSDQQLPFPRQSVSGRHNDPTRVFWSFHNCPPGFRAPQWLRLDTLNTQPARKSETRFPGVGIRLLDGSHNTMLEYKLLE